MSKRLFAIGLMPANVVLAACLRRRYDSVRIVSRALIAREVERWRQLPDLQEITIVLDGVGAPKQVHAGLAALLKSGVNVTWVCRNMNADIESAVHGLRGLDLRAGLSQEGYLEQEGLLDSKVKKLFKASGDPGSVLPDFIRYTTNRMLMGNLCLAPLEEAIEQIGNMAETGTFDRLPEKEMASLEQFRDTDFPYLEGQSKSLRDLKMRITKVGNTDLSVLILGNTGTGKEGVAFYLHDYSPRRGKPFVAVNCAALEPELLRSELFGHERGAFTGAIGKKIGLCEMARGGTLFLDEIGNMPLPIQTALLRFLETRRYRTVGGTEEKRADIRVIAAAQRNLTEKISRGEFRQDLYYRLAQVELETPDLKDVRQDIPLIMRQLVYKRFQRKNDYELIHSHLKNLETAYRNQMPILNAYEWPGNVRELAALTLRTIELGENSFAELAKRIQSSESTQPGHSPDKLFGRMTPGCILPLDLVKREYTKAILKCNPEISRIAVAKKLGIAYNTLKKLDDS